MNINSDETVILLVPASKEDVDKTLLSILEQVKGLPLIEGIKSYTAIVFDPPAYPEEENRLAISLSNKFKDTVYSLWTYEEEPYNLHHYRDGKKIKSEYTDVHEFILELGISLTPKKTKDIEILASISILQGINDIDEIKKCLLQEYDPEEIDEINFYNHSEGILVQNLNGDTDHIVFSLFDHYDFEATTIKITSANEFLLFRENKSKELVKYIFPKRVTEHNDDPNLIRDVKGEIEPKEILKSLDIDIEMLPQVKKI